MSNQPTIEATRWSNFWKNRPMIFVATYMIGVILVPGIRFFPDYGNFSRVALDFVVTIICIPWGLAGALEWVLQHAFGRTNTELIIVRVGSMGIPSAANDSIRLLIGLSYLLFFVILLAGSFNRNQRTFRIFYLIFITLLIISIGGCLAIVPD